MALIKEGIEGFASRESMEDHMVTDNEVFGQCLEILEFCAVACDVESDMNCSGINSKALENAIDAMPTVYIGNTEEVEIVF